MNIQSEEKLKESATVILLKGIIHCIESPDWKVLESSINIQNDINEFTKTLNGKSFKIDISFENLKR